MIMMYDADGLRVRSPLEVIVLMEIYSANACYDHQDKPEKELALLLEDGLVLLQGDLWKLTPQGHRRVELMLRL